MHLHDVTDLAVQGHDGSRVGARQFDDRLRGLDGDQGLIERDDVADGDLPVDDLRLDESFADVGQ